MRYPVKNIVGFVLLTVVCLIPSYALAREQVQGEKTLGARQESADAAPDLAEIIPLSTELSGRLAVFENTIAGMPDVSEVQKKYAEIEANLKAPSDQLQRLKDSKEHRYKMLMDLRRAIVQENELLQESSKPLNKAISQLGTLRKDWLGEKEKWKVWQSTMLKAGELGQLRSTFAKANGTIDTALNLIIPKLEAMLMVQERAGNIQEKIDSLTARSDGLILIIKQSILFDASPPMLSPRYFSQFGGRLWYAAQKGMDEISWPDKLFFARNGWIVFLQGFLSLIVIIAVYRNRQALNESKRWGFLAARPLAAGFFVGIMITLLFYEYGKIPAMWGLINTIVAGTSFARLSRRLVEEPWKRQFLYGLVIVLIVNGLLYLVSLPLPLARLYLVLAALAGLFFCLRWARESGRGKDSGSYTWSLRIGSLFFAAIMIIEIWGKRSLGTYLFVSLIHSIATVLVLMLFTYMINGVVEWLFRTSPLRRAAVPDTDAADAIIRRVAHFIDVVIWGLILLPAVLMIWGVYDSLEEATKGLLALGFNVGSKRISVGLVIVSAGIIYGSFLASWILQKLIIDEVLVRRQAERGVRLSMGRLVHYAFIFAGFLLAISILGVEITKLTIILSALGVGLGFGLQGVVNNFVSGLILLFERPVRVGDYIELDGN